MVGLSQPCFHITKAVHYEFLEGLFVFSGYDSR